MFQAAKINISHPNNGSYHKLTFPSLDVKTFTNHSRKPAMKMFLKGKFIHSSRVLQDGELKSVDRNMSRNTMSTFLNPPHLVCHTLYWKLSPSYSFTWCFGLCFLTARGSVHPEVRQLLRERYDIRSRRPLQYIQALREANRMKPHGNPLPSAQFPNERDLSNQNQRLDPPSRPRSAPPRNRPAAKSILKVPPLTFQSQTEETRPAANRGQSKRPFSVGFHLNSPSEFSDPIFQLAVSVPLSHTPQSSKPPSRNIANTQATEQNQPLPLGYSSQYTAPTGQGSEGQIPTRQSPIIAKPDLTEYPTPSWPISHYPQQYANLYIGYHNAQMNPTSEVYGEGQGGQTLSSDPTYVRLPLFDYAYSRYDGTQMNPTTVYGEDQSGQTVSPNPVSLSQYERFPSGQYNAGPVKPSGNGYVTHQSLLPVGTGPASSPQQYSSHFKPSSGPKQETAPPSSPQQYSSHFIPSSGPKQETAPPSSPQQYSSHFIPSSGPKQETAPPSSPQQYSSHFIPSSGPKQETAPPSSPQQYSSHFKPSSGPKQETAPPSSPQQYSSHFKPSSGLKQETAPPSSPQQYSSHFIPSSGPKQETAPPSSPQQYSSHFKPSSGPKQETAPPSSPQQYSSHFKPSSGLKQETAPPSSPQQYSSHFKPSSGPKQETAPPSSPQQYSSHFKPSSGPKQETAPPSSPQQYSSHFKPSSGPKQETAPPSQYEVPFSSFNGEVSPTTYGPVDVVQGAQMDFSSSSGPSSRGQSGPAALPDHLTAFGSSENGYQTGSSGRGKPSYTKLLLDMDDELDEGPGPPARTPLYGGYPGQAVAESPLPQTMNSMSQDQQSGPLGSTYTNTPVYVRPPMRDSGVNPYASNPQTQMLPEQMQVSDVVPQKADVASYVGPSAGSVPTYLDQQHLPKINIYAMLVALGQHPVLWQPSRDQSTEQHSLNPSLFQHHFIQNTAPYNPYQVQVHGPPPVGVS